MTNPVNPGDYGPINGMPGDAGNNNTGSNPVTNFTQNDNFLSNSWINLNPFAPLQMKTLVYSPDVRVVVETSNGTQYDISRDIVRGQVIRKENSVSTLFVTLTNKPLKYLGTPRYNGLFDRMDKIVCYMKGPRGWICVFTGYLDTVPYAQMWPGVVELEASCTLKRLIHTYWNPGLAASQQFFDQYGMYAQHGIMGTSQSPPSDSGLGNMLADILNRVGGWQPQDILIQDFPLQFIAFLEANYQLIEMKNQTPVENFRRILLSDDTSGGVGSSAGKYQSPAGVAASMPGPQGHGQPFYLTEIVAATDLRSMGPLSQDVANSQDLIAAGRAGLGDRDSRQAWEMVGEGPGTVWQTYAKFSDAAILIVACALRETGMMNFGNAAVPESINFNSDGPGPFTDSGVGMLHLQNWGTVYDEMNPRIAAGMLLDRLKAIDWRNMDPATAISLAKGGLPAFEYQAFLAPAAAMVLAYREAQQGGSSTTMGNTSSGGALNLPAAATSVASSVTSPSSPIAAPGTPVPDAQGAINYAISKQGSPYVWGGNGPGAFDCSGFVGAAYASIGVNIPRTTQAIAKMPGRVSPAQIQPGDLIVSPAQDHVVMALTPGGGTIIEATTPIVHIAPQYYNLASCTVIHVANASGNPAALFNPAATYGGGTPTGATGYTGNLLQPGVGSHSEPIARNLFSYMFEPGVFADEISDQFTGEKAFINDQPLIQMIQAICKAGLRNFQSAPTGEFVAYYPDWFGLDGKRAILNLQDIECKNVTVSFSDKPLTTHVYVAGDYTQMGESQGDLGWLDTCGVVTVEDQWLYERLTAIAPSTTRNLDAGTLLNRFGVRPYKEEYVLAGSHALEFLIAAHIFMLKWAEQYRTTIQLTFMPDLFPGMRINLAGKNLQVYVTEVVHDFDFESGFSTTAQIMAPSSANAAGNVMGFNNSTAGATANPTGQMRYFG